LSDKEDERKANIVEVGAARVPWTGGDFEAVVRPRGDERRALSGGFTFSPTGVFHGRDTMGPTIRSSGGTLGEDALGTTPIAAGHDVPPYTSSLDAALPHERIVHSYFDEDLELWFAVHKSSSGSITIGHAPTGPSARRAAAFRALANGQVEAVAHDTRSEAFAKLADAINALTAQLAKSNSLAFEPKAEEKLSLLRSGLEMLTNQSLTLGGIMLLCGLMWFATKVVEKAMEPVIEEVTKQLVAWLAGIV